MRNRRTTSDTQGKPPRVARRDRRSRVRAAAVVTLGLVFPGVGLGIGGCGPTVGGRDWPIAPVTYEGPFIDALVDDGLYTVRVQSPTPGWEVEVEGTERLVDERRVFITLTRPNPEFLYPAVVVEQLVRTRVPVTEPIALYGRVLEYRSEDDPPFERIGEP